MFSLRTRILQRSLAGYQPFVTTDDRDDTPLRAFKIDAAKSVAQSFKVKDSLPVDQLRTLHATHHALGSHQSAFSSGTKTDWAADDDENSLASKIDKLKMAKLVRNTANTLSMFELPTVLLHDWLKKMLTDGSRQRMLNSKHVIDLIVRTTSEPCLIQLLKRRTKDRSAETAYY